MSYKVYGYIKSADPKLDIKGLSVKAWDIDIKYHDHLGDAVTDENGYFEIKFERDAFSPPWPLSLLEGGPDIKIEVFDTGGNLIHTSDKIQGAGVITDLGDIQIELPEKIPEPEPEPEPETMEICADQSTPDGWVTIDYKKDYNKCGGGVGIKDNVKLILRYDGLPAGESIRVCSGSDCPTPDGWVVIDYDKENTKCRGGIGIEDNIKLIQKIGVVRSLPIKGSSVQITNILYDGLVPRVESDEYVEITNLGTEPQDLAGWVLKDIAEGYPSFTFPQWVLKPRETIRVYTNEIHLLWGGFSFGYGKAIWNNKKPDTAALYNAQGEEISRKSYSV